MRNFACFNELSASSNLYSDNQLRDYLIRLVLTLHEAWELGVKKLRIHEKFRTIQTNEGKFLEEILRTLSFDERGILYAATDSPFIPKHEETQTNTFISSRVIRVNGNPINECEGLFCAWIHNVLSISFASAPEWLTSSVNITLHRDKDSSELITDIPHASHPSHISEHVVSIGQMLVDLSTNPPSYSKPLPNSDFAKKFIANGDWGSLACELNNCAATEKISRILKIAEKIALINGYLFEEEITKKNRQISGSYRQIFSCEKGMDGKIYLSTDFEKGAFEVCKESGAHLGEWTFDGKKHKGGDTSHSIEV